MSLGRRGKKGNKTQMRDGDVMKLKTQAQARYLREGGKGDFVKEGTTWRATVWGDYQIALSGLQKSREESARFGEAPAAITSQKEGNVT